MVRRNLRGPFERLVRFPYVRLLHQNDGQVHQDVGVVRLDRERPAIHFDGAGEVAFTLRPPLCEEVSVGIQRVEIVGVGSKDAVTQFLCLSVILLHLQLNHRVVVCGGEIPRMQFENPLKRGFRLVRVPPQLLEQDCVVEQRVGVVWAQLERPQKVRLRLCRSLLALDFEEEGRVVAVGVSIIRPVFQNLSVQRHRLRVVLPNRMQEDRIVVEDVDCRLRAFRWKSHSLLVELFGWIEIPLGVEKAREVPQRPCVLRLQCQRLNVVLRGLSDLLLFPSRL
mmetsp:Transcript_40062/g.95012  ORF Transcript_40062/g.95012 Transcript_40062/m.95012 type:complete len:280 (+) Transcript_40062:344-1183(+)